MKKFILITLCALFVLASYSAGKGNEKFTFRKSYYSNGLIIQCPVNSLTIEETESAYNLTFLDKNGNVWKKYSSNPEDVADAEYEKYYYCENDTVVVLDESSVFTSVSITTKQNIIDGKKPIFLFYAFEPSSVKGFQ